VALVLRGSKVEKYKVVVWLRLEQPSHGFDVGYSLYRDMSLAAQGREWGNFLRRIEEEVIPDDQIEAELKEVQRQILKIPMGFEESTSWHTMRKVRNFYLIVEDYSEDPDKKFAVAKELKEQMSKFLSILGYSDYLQDEVELDIDSY